MPDPTTGDIASKLPKPIAFVMGGGGSLGAIQVGMLQAVSEHRIDPDMVVGTSIGSLNGAMIAEDPRGAVNRLAHVWPELRHDHAFPGGITREAMTFGRSRNHVYPNTGMREIASRMLNVETFEELALPFGCVAVDTKTTETVLMRSGTLVDAILASGAIPGVFPAVERGDRLLYDGGLTDAVPIRQAVEMGAKSLVIFDCMFSGHAMTNPEGVIELVMFAMAVMGHRAARGDLALIAPQMPVVYLPGPRPIGMSMFDFDHTNELIDGAYAQSRSFLAGLEIDGPGLYGSLEAPNTPLSNASVD